MDRLPSPPEVQEMMQSGRISVRVMIAHPPLKKDTELHGELIREYAFPADQTHFAGYTGKDDATDHSQDAVPLLSLIQGFRDKRTRKSCPSTLPSGKTVVNVVQERLTAMVKNPEDSLVVRSVWNGKMRRSEIHLIWDAEKWDDRMVRLAEQAARKRAEREAARGGYRS